MYQTVLKTAGGTILAVASLLVVLVVGAADANASTYVEAKTVTSGGQTWVAVNAPFAGTGIYNQSALVYKGSSTIVQAYSPVRKLVPFTPDSYTYSIGQEVGIYMNTIFTFLTEGETYTIVMCPLESAGKCNTRDWSTPAYANRDEALSVPGVYYTVFTKTGGVLVPGGPVIPNWSTTETRITGASVTGTGYNTNFIVDYFLKTSEFNSTNRPDTMMVNIINTASEQVATNKVLILPLEDGTASTALNSGVPTAGDYTAYFNFYNFASGLPTFTRSSLVMNFTVDNAGDVTSSEIVDMSDGLLGQPLNEYQPVPCGVTAIGGCIQNAFATLFYPTPESIESFTQLYDTLSTKFPFAYFTDFNDSIASVFADTTTSTLGLTVPFGVFGDITLISAEQIEEVPLTELIRTLLGALIWIMLGYTIYRRTSQIFNTQTT